MIKHIILTSCLSAGVLCALPQQAHAFRVIGADPAGGTTCSGTRLPCNTDQLVTRWFNLPVPFWVNQNAALDAADPGLAQIDIVSNAKDGYQAWEDAPDSIVKFAWVSETAARLGADGINTTLFFNAALDSGDRGRCQSDRGAGQVASARRG